MQCFISCFILYKARKPRLVYCAWGALRERERERERERDREREGDRERVSEREAEVTSPSPRWNWRWVCTFPCQKFALIVSPFSNGHHYTAKIRNEFALSFAKKNRTLCSDSLKWCGEQSKTQNKWSKLSSWPVQDCSFHRKKWIKLIPKAIGNRKSDCEWTLRSANFISWCWSLGRNLNRMQSLFYQNSHEISNASL